jgi:hypothetical protein
MSRRAMKPSYVLLAALPLVAAGWGALAQAPASKSKPGAGGKPMVLLLDNFQVVDGTVERVGDAYRLRRGKDVTDYPAGKVLFAGESRDEVYKLMMARGVKPPAPPSADLNSAALRAFPAKVQPVVMNLCADCHAKPDHPGEFKLTRVPAGYAHPEASHRNAKEVARFVSRENPSASPLLTKAVTAHGGQRAPALYDASHPAYRNLELWAHWVAGPERSPMPETVPARKPTVMSAPQPAAIALPAPSPVVKSDDPYDPAVFNRATRPQK